MALLDNYDAGIVGELVDGTLRVAFGRTCEMVNNLVTSLHAQDKDLLFPPIQTYSLHLNIVPAFQSAVLPENVFNTFTRMPTKMGTYTFSKKALAGSTLRQLFAQIDECALILEDEPGTDFFYLHVGKNAEQKEHSSIVTDFHRMPNDYFTPKLLVWVFVLTAVVAIILYEPVHPHHEWVLKTLSTIYKKLQTFLSS